MIHLPAPTGEMAEGSGHVNVRKELTTWKDLWDWRALDISILWDTEMELWRLPPTAVWSGGYTWTPGRTSMDWKHAEPPTQGRHSPMQSLFAKLNRTLAPPLDYLHQSENLQTALIQWEWDASLPETVVTNTQPLDAHGVYSASSMEPLLPSMAFAIW